MLILDFSIVNVALPAIGGQFGLSDSGLQWVAGSYGLTLGGLLLLGGRLSDLLGRRRLFVAGLAVFSVASLAGGLAVSGLMLIVMRAVQGIGAAMVAPALLSLITTIFAEGPRRNRALGWFGAAGASGFALGAFLGGVLTHFISWRAVLLVNVPPAAIAIAAALYLFRDRPGHGSDGGYDVPGGLTGTAGLLAVVYGLIQAGQSGLAAPAAVIPLTGGVLLLAGFAWLEARAKSPLMPLRVFRLRALSAASGTAVLASMMIGASILMLSLQLQDVDGLSPLAAGLAFLPLGVLVGAVATIAPRLASALGLKPVLATGTASGYAYGFGAAAVVGLIWQNRHHHPSPQRRYRVTATLPLRQETRLRCGRKVRTLRTCGRRAAGKRRGNHVAASGARSGLVGTAGVSP